jgi:hypothetical protein
MKTMKIKKMKMMIDIIQLKIKIILQIQDIKIVMIITDIIIVIHMVAQKNSEKRKVVKNFMPKNNIVKSMIL